MPDDRYGILSTYLRDPILDFLSSSQNLRISSYTASSYDTDADANGDKIVFAGTVMEAVAGPMATPRTSGTAIGICTRTVNLRDGDADIGLMTGGYVNESRLWDNGSFGSVAAGVKTDLPFIKFESYSG